MPGYCSLCVTCVGAGPALQHVARLEDHRDAQLTGLPVCLAWLYLLSSKLQDFLELTYVGIALNHHHSWHSLGLPHTQSHSPVMKKCLMLISECCEYLLTCARTPGARHSPWISGDPPGSRPSLGCHSRRTLGPPRGGILQFEKNVRSRNRYFETK